MNENSSSDGGSSSDEEGRPELRALSKMIRQQTSMMQQQSIPMPRARFNPAGFGMKYHIRIWENWAALVNVTDDRKVALFSTSLPQEQLPLFLELLEQNLSYEDETFDNENQ